MKNRRSKWLSIIIVVVAILLIFNYFNSAYNTMVQHSEAVDQQWANVENTYQRRTDLIPNLVNTVKGYADFERKTLEAVINARAKATSIQLDPQKLTPEIMQQFQQAQAGLSGALGRLMVVVERYPELKANQNFLDLQAQLEGTENRIATERRKFNETARIYNTYIKMFPKNIFASMFGFKEKPYFEAVKGADQPPKVKF